MNTNNSNLKNYYYILTSIIINNFGDVLFDLFIVWNITKQSGEIFNAVYLVGSSILFRAILAMFIGILVDHKNKKYLIIISNISSATIILCFFILYKAIISNIWIGLIFILLNDINNEVFSRSYITLGAELFEENRFIKFQSTNTIAVRIINILGSAIVGFLIAYVTSNLIFIIDILTFLISAVLILNVKYEYKNSCEEKSKFFNIVKVIGEDIKFTFKSIYKISFLKNFVILMFILNLAYGFIPYILPVIISLNNNSSIMLGFIKSAMAVGEVLGLLLVTRFGNCVSSLFKISMIGCTCCMMSLIGMTNTNVIIFIFLIYGVLDSITQPLFSHTISSIKDESRGKILGGIDTIILLSPSLGMLVGTKLMNLSYKIGFVFLAIIFVTAFILVVTSKDFNNIYIKKVGGVHEKRKRNV